jgi:hypothetical protein
MGHDPCSDPDSDPDLTLTLVGSESGSESELLTQNLGQVRNEKVGSGQGQLNTAEQKQKKKEVNFRIRNVGGLQQPEKENKVEEEEEDPFPLVNYYISRFQVWPGMLEPCYGTFFVLFLLTALLGENH